MSKEKSMALRIKNLKRGEYFTVRTPNERAAALRAKKFCEDLGLLKVDIKTIVTEAGDFKIYAI